MDHHLREVHCLWSTEASERSVGAKVGLARAPNESGRLEVIALVEVIHKSFQNGRRQISRIPAIQVGLDVEEQELLGVDIHVQVSSDEGLVSLSGVHDIVSVV